jgi:1-hydroxycarotenoid 3,4-desaturase
MPDHRVVVIGAGIAGLVSALELAHQGLQVTVLEAADAPGGKMRQPRVDGAAIDSGPTVMTMRWVFDEILGRVGTRLDDQLRLTPLSVLARHFWDGASSLDLYADPKRSLDAVGRFAGAQEARRFEHFCRTAREVYLALEGPFIRSCAPSFTSMGGALGARGLATLARIGPMRSLWDSLGQHFRDPRLRQLFARYATYCGSSPWQAPATLMLIAQVELEGVWSVDGGMHELALCLARLAQSRGAQLHLGCHCAEIVIHAGRVRGVRLADGQQIDADSVIFNGDLAALRSGLLGQGARSAAPARAAQRSLSALTWSIHAPARGLALDRHNVFFQDDYASEFEDIFRAGRLPRRPTVYLCAQDRGTGHEPQGAERLLCLVNAPARGDVPADKQTDEDIEQCQTTAFDLLSRCGLSLQPQPHQVLRTTPRDFHRLFPATGGALYGQATHGWMSAFARPGSTSPIPGLYLAGGSVHPGPGVPMAALSGHLAAAALMASPALTKRLHPVATSGGMSMP